MSTLPQSTPEAQGISSRAILGFIEAAEACIDAFHSFMLLRHGHVVASGWWEPYAAERPHVLFSLSKSFTSTAVGLAAAEGRLTLDDPVLQYFPAEAPARPSRRLTAMRIRHLLSMATGHTEDTTRSLHVRRDGDWARAFLNQPVRRDPGSFFLYNSGATYMLSAIVQRVSGVTLLEYLRPRLLDPLGITQAAWDSCPRGVNTGGWGLHITTDAIARFGQLYLRDGIWNGQRILPEGWVAQASAKHISNGANPDSDWEQGYGFQFWRCRHHAYRGDGAFGQYCVIMPEQDAVLAITSGLGDMQPPLNLVWEHLLPAMSAAPLAEDRAAAELLEQKLSTLRLNPQTGASTAPGAAAALGKTYMFAKNAQKIKSFRLDSTGDGISITISDANGEHRVICGAGAWREDVTTLESGSASAVAASGAWTGNQTYTAQIYFNETPFRLTLDCHFDGDRLDLDAQMNVGFEATARPRLSGTRR